MQSQEKKYLVDSFEGIQQKLKALGASIEKESQSDHYYTQQPNNDVIKLVVQRSKAEIHKLEDRGGQFVLIQIIPVENMQVGLTWLKQQGYKMVDVVRMTNTTFRYKGGTVGLYTVNDSLRSVILDYPKGQHEAIESELGLQTAERITTPYNKYLEKIGKIQSIGLK